MFNYTKDELRVIRNRILYVSKYAFAIACLLFIMAIIVSMTAESIEQRTIELKSAVEYIKESEKSSEVNSG